MTVVPRDIESTCCGDVSAILSRRSPLSAFEKLAVTKGDLTFGDDEVSVEKIWLGHEEIESRRFSAKIGDPYLHPRWDVLDVCGPLARGKMKVRNSFQNMSKSVHSPLLGLSTCFSVLRSIPRPTITPETKTSGLSPASLGRLVLWCIQFTLEV
jgi:hypothetical protein